ncbi:MAG TPA: DUF2231 domain-containing protein [Candidatus Saccharimonadaceae bacterium]|jgi:hypothetical protein|nr:DUF2231 domain-containing protein [Candidatus Saccharimonadaceae bacterium]
MNAPQLHLMLNHVPVLGVIFAAAALSAGLWWRRGSLMRFGLFTIIAASIAAMPVFFSGGASEDAVERLAGVQKPMIEQHEDAATAASVGLAVLGITALFVLIRYRKRTMPAPAVASVLAGTLVLAAVLAWTAHLGGSIRHAELNGGASAASTPAEAEASESE